VARTRLENVDEPDPQSRSILDFPREEERWQTQDDLEENSRERANGDDTHMASSRRCRQGQNRMADKCRRLMLQTERKLKEEDSY
jgi:hypothetical protein